MFTTIALLGLTLFSSGSDVQADCTDDGETPVCFIAEPVWEVSDDPCPAGTSATVPAGSSYEAGIWEDPQGNLLGFARTEDSCVVTMTDDLADAPIPADLTHGVREVRVIDGYPHIVTFDVDAPTYDYPPNGTNPPDPADPPQGGLPATR